VIDLQKPAFPDTPSHVLSLVSTTLDEYEDVPLHASLRRALRIARLRGDAQEAFRFDLELGLADTDQDSEADIALGERWRHAEYAAFIQDRTADVEARNLGYDRDGPVTYSGPIDSLVLEPPPYEQELSLQSRIENSNRQVVVDRILASVRNRTFKYLIGCETELRLSVTGEKLFGRHRRHVDRLLRAAAPEVLDKLSSALRRANESGDPEARTQALTSCRRVLVAVADLVFPASQSPHVDSKGQTRDVGAGNYRNRILAALDRAEGILSKALQAAVGDFASRLDRLDELTQKGVHSQVAEDEMEFGIVQTYILAGEVLSMTLPEPDDKDSATST
jgi:hypothetical protein